MCGESRTHGVNRGKSWKHWKRQAYLSELAESAKAENRPNDVRYQYIIIGNDLLFVIINVYSDGQLVVYVVAMHQDTW